ncbi:hypothetical protein Pint_16956 [Pistacia integerrima]|uniref:Uncharacterized protein n=1 Tax=Pistacia integerrima TaxID=434235 RepID=A0ACC0Z8T3_9ROSI|nr:hypothetical protein Pint_16956 [Pistacia integerrima]
MILPSCIKAFSNSLQSLITNRERKETLSTLCGSFLVFVSVKSEGLRIIINETLCLKAINPK